MKYGYVCVTAAYVIWGLLTIYWKFLEDLSPLYILSARIVYSFFFCVLLVLLKKNWPQIKKELSQPKRMVRIAAAGALVTLNWGTYIAAVNTGHILDASMGYYLNPLVVVLFGVIFFKEKLNVWEGTSIMIAALGVLIMLLRYGHLPWIAAVLAFSFAAYGAIKKTLNLDSLTSLTLETVSMFPIFAVILFHMDYSGQGAMEFGWPMMLLAISTGVVTAIPLLLYGVAVRTIPFSILGFFQYISPTISLVIGLVLYGETLTVEDLMTFVFIWVALLIFLGHSIFKLWEEKHHKAEKQHLEIKTDNHKQLS